MPADRLSSTLKLLDYSDTIDFLVTFRTLV